MDLNYLHPNQAKHLIHKITNYWKMRGYNGIKAWTEKLDFGGEKLDAEGWVVREGWVVVRSNIGPNGYPPKRPE